MSKDDISAAKKDALDNFWRNILRFKNYSEEIQKEQAKARPVTVKRSGKKNKAKKTCRALGHGK